MKIAHFQTDGSTSKCSELYHPKPSSPCMVSLGIRLLNRATLPLARAIESCWKRWRMVVVSSSPVWRAGEGAAQLLGLADGHLVPGS